MTGVFERTGRFIERVTTEDLATVAARMTSVDIDIVAPMLTPAIETAIAMTTTLLLRLDAGAPRLHLDLPASRSANLPRLGEGSLLDELAREHEGFRSIDRLAAGRSECPALRLDFGGDGGDGVVVASAGWACALGASLPDGPGNALAASFAGVVAAAEALKVALKGAAVGGRLREWRGVVSLWDYSLTATVGPAIPDMIDLDGVVFVGCGGIASAIAWPLALLRLAGAPVAVDGDVLDDTNLNRHLTGSFREIGVGKAQLFKVMLEAAGATPVEQPTAWDAVDAAQRGAVDLGVISVDDDLVRRDFQLDLPRRILNGGTSDEGLYQVTTHDFVNEACLRCIARANLRGGGPEESLARRLGVPVDELRSHLQQDQPLPDEVLRNASAGDREVLEGVRGRDVVRVACGHLKPRPDEPAVSAPMLSAAPGVLLAGEIVKDRMDAETPLSPPTNALATSILTGPHDRWLMRRHKRGECECRDPIYVKFYRSRWGEGTQR
jgi:hypothetical protein